MLLITEPFPRLIIFYINTLFVGFPGGSVVKIHLPMQETQETRVGSLGQEDPLEEGTVNPLPRTEELGGLQSMGSQRVGQD